MAADLTVRPLVESDLDEADRIFRLAFGTFVGMPDPMAWAGDSDWVRNRWRADPEASLGAFDGETLVGSNLVTIWGSFGFFGPITVRPDLWDRGVARALLGPTLEIFERRGAGTRGLFTFAQSAKHQALYGKYGFHPRFLTHVMAKAPGAGTAGIALSAIGAKERPAALAAIRGIADTLLPGLDPTPEVEAIAARGLGETILASSGGRIDAFAICHAGAGSEAGSGTVYVKLGASRAGDARGFERLLDALEAFAARSGSRLVLGVNLAREAAWRVLLARGFRTEIVGVAMQSPNEPGWNRPDVFALDDWR